jgi:hypothetical protein
MSAPRGTLPPRGSAPAIPPARRSPGVRSLALSLAEAPSSHPGRETQPPLETCHAPLSLPAHPGGSDHPLNGIVFCLNHHRALDGGLFQIDPRALQPFQGCGIGVLLPARGRCACGARTQGWVLRRLQRRDDCLRVLPSPPHGSFTPHPGVA